MVKKVAKKAFKGGSKSSVLTLDAILEMTYVTEVMDSSDLEKIKKTYGNAPEEAKAKLSSKLIEIQSMYDRFSAEKDPEKRKSMMFKAVQEGAVKLKEDAKKLKKVSLRKLEEAQHSQEVAAVEDKLSKL